MKPHHDKPQPRGELTLQLVTMASNANNNGDIYAGWLVNQMDLAGATAAGRIARGRTATVAIEGMEFLSPVRIGAEVAFYTHLEDIGRSSMKIRVEVWTRDQTEHHARKVTEALFVNVAIDEHGRIRQVPQPAQKL
mgnify:FL=1